MRTKLSTLVLSVTVGFGAAGRAAEKDVKPGAAAEADETGLADAEAAGPGADATEVVGGAQANQAKEEAKGAREGQDPGEPAIQGAGPAADFLRAAHARVHRRWAENFLPMAARQLAKGHPVNDPKLVVGLAATLDRRGALVDVRVEASSGTQEFDDTALDVIRDSAPFGAPPEAALSDDDRLHVRWSLARDHRACSDVAAVDVEAPFDEAFPRLLKAGRDGEVLRRVKKAVQAGNERAVTALARAWLRRALANPKTAGLSGGALLAAGDADGEEPLVGALRKGEAVELRASVKLRTSLCEAVKPLLARDGTREQAAAAGLLRGRAEVACVPALVAMAGNKKLPVAVRALAIEALGGTGDSAAKGAITAAEQEKSPALRAAAVLAVAQPGGGKAVLFKLTPLLRDPAIDVRIAASVGLVRSVGDQALEQLYLLYKETDPRPYEAVAAALGRLSSQASADMLVRMLRKDDRRARVAAAAALAGRSDAGAQAALQVILKDTDPSVRVFAAVAMGPGERGLALDGVALSDSGMRVFRALAAGGGPARVAAASWLAARFSGANPAQQIELLGKWLEGASRSEPVANAQ